MIKQLFYCLIVLSKCATSSNIPSPQQQKTNTGCSPTQRRIEMIATRTHRIFRLSLPRGPTCQKNNIVTALFSYDYERNTVQRSKLHL